MAYRILFTGGDTGGHTYPLVSIARAVSHEAQQAGKRVEMEFLGSGQFMKMAALEAGVPFRRIMSAKLRRYFSLLTVLDFLKLPVLFFQSLFSVWSFMPDLVFTKGGATSFMPAFAARLLFIPIYIHESDSVPGLGNKRLARFAQKIFIAFEESKAYFDPAKTILVGHPVREEVLKGDRAQAFTVFKLSDQKPVVLVIGGSQGARGINNIVKDSLIELTAKFQVLHQSGDSGYAEFDGNLKQIIRDGANSYGPTIEQNYRLYPFFNTREMALAYAVSDVIVSRAGAGSIAEIAALGKPAIFIPLPDSASDHQMINAVNLAKFGAMFIEEQNLTLRLFMQEIQKAYDMRVELSEKIKNFARPDAAKLIAQAILK